MVNNCSTVSYDFSLVVPDAVDAEVQVGALELEEFLQKLLKPR